MRDFQPDPPPPGLDALSREAAVRFGDTAAFAFPTRDGRRQSLTTLEPVFRDHAIDRTTGVDTPFAGLLADPWVVANPLRLRFAISGGTALRPTTHAARSSRVGPVLEGYGMTETCCIIACNQANPALILPGTVGIPIPGCEVRLVDDEGRPSTPGVPGEDAGRRRACRLGLPHR